MTTEFGRQAGIAFEAVRQCHQDLGRLIADLDGSMTGQGLRRLWNQDAVTSGVSRASYASYWMAKRLYRLYHNPETANHVVEGINIRFFSDDGSLPEPRLIVGCIVYDVPPTKTIESIAQTWDLDNGYREWCNATSEDLGKVLSCNASDNGRILRMIAVGLDLYSIQSLEMVKQALDTVRHQFRVA